jgi:hypothetical protein
MKTISALRSIRAYCLDCSGDNNAEVRKCVIPACPLFRYRMGKTGRKASPAQLAALARMRTRGPLGASDADTAGHD